MLIKKLIILFLFSTVILAQTPKVLTGIDVLVKENFKQLENKKIGLVTNPTGVDQNLRSTIDILFEAENVDLVALFGPEHGVRGNFAAGEYIEFYNDEKTNLPVFSLYGKTRKPSKEMLEGIETLVFDIQDIGSRSYTYISTMGMVLTAAAEYGLEVIVLDRPNPLGGNRIEGNLVEDGFYSFVSQFNVPYVHGLTVGELAELLNNEGMLEDAAKCNLSVIKMEGWEREMRFKETGLEWVPTSPHIPEPDSPFYYTASGIAGELQIVSNGVGYTLPFKLLGADFIDGVKLADKMNAIELKGVEFRPISFKPYYGFGEGVDLHGVQIHITDFSKVELMPIQFYFMEIVHEMYPDFDPFAKASKSRLSMFDKVMGTDRIRDAFGKRYKTEDILPILHEDIEYFKKISSKYYLY